MRDAIERPLIYEEEDVRGQSEGRVAKCSALSRGRQTVVTAGVEEGRCTPHRSIFLNYLVLWLIYI